MTQQFVDLCHKYGKAVWVFGPELDDVNAQNAAWDLGIDAIFSDVPDLCIKNLNARQKTNP